MDSLKVGDVFDYAITLNRNKEYDDVVFPDSSDFGTSFEIRSRKQYKVSSFKDSVSFKLQFFGTSDTTIPALAVHLVQQQDTTTLYTNPIPIAFKTVLAKNDQKLRPLKPIFDFASAWWPYILAVIVLAGVGYYIYRYYLKQQEAEQPKEPKTFKPVPFVNPLHEFQRAIKELDKMEFSSREEYKKFYIRLGDAIRQYYESLYNIPALESTSRELLNMLKAGAIDENLVADTRSVLQEADMVKFAKFTPTPDQADRALKKAYNFLERAREVDGARIEHLRRKHMSKVEAERQRFMEEQEKTEEVTS
ncbi:MAG: hypothetical protein PVH63_06485 [Balneolaceae bacterium]